MAEFTALDGNGNDSLKIRWNNGLPDATFSADSGISITKAHLNWKPTIADTGIHNFTLTTFDDHCPSIGSTTKSYKLVVKIKPTISTTSDTLIPCGAIVPISSTVLTGNAPFVYSWPGRSETTPLINVGHGIYTARVQDATGCFAEDTIKLIGSSISGGIQTDTSCLVEGVQLTAVTYSADTNLTYTYQWTFPPETQLYTTKTIRRTFATSGVKNVVLKLMASDNCSVTIPTTIKVCDPPPVIVQYAPNVCQGQQFKIGCGIPGIGGLCGAHTIGIILTERNWIGYTSTGLYILPPDSLRPDSNTFKVITESVSKCSNQKIFKFRVKASPKVKIYPDRSSIVFNCNRPDTTVLIKIYKDYRYVADSLWGKIQYLDTTINLAKTVHDTIYYTLKLSKPCIVSISGIMANNCQAFSSIYYQPGAFATATTSSHCTATDSVSIGSNLQSNRFTSYVFNLGNGNQTTDSIPKIFYPPNQVFHGYFAIQDTLGCRDTADFVVDTRLPDTTVFASADSACLEGFIKLRVMDTTIIYKWSFENSSSGLVLPRGRLEDSLQFVNPGFDTIKATIAFKEGCVSSWNLPVTYVRQPIWPTSSISNICAVDSSRFNGGVSFSEFPIRSWRWKYQYPSNVSLPFSEDTVQNPVRLFNYNGSLLSILTVVNIKGCMARDTLDSNMVLISEPEFDVNGNCQNDSLIFFFGRVPDRYENIDRFTYIYNDGSVESTSNGQGLHQFSEPGVYKIKLIAFSADGCTNRDSTTLTIKPRPKADFAFPVGELCEDQTVFLSGRNSQPAAPGEKITSFVWATGDTNPVSEDTSATITIPGSGNTFIALQVKSTNGCQDYLKFPFISRPRPVPDFIANEEDLLKGDIISFQDLSTGGTVWRWDYGDGNIETITDPAKSSPSHKYTFGSAFSVEQWVASSYGCADSLSKPVNLKSYIALPKAFTPNGDQLNDGCGLLYRYIKNLEEFRIYNRLGQVVFDGGHDLDARWNGKLEGVNQPNGSYLFTAKATSVFGENLELKGNITLIR